MQILIRNHRNEKWQLVKSAAFGSESELQNLLAEEPSLISVNEVREGAGTMVAAIREFPLDIGSIDLVGFAARGDIAIIACKLASNDEIKRKVIGQVFG
jgi:RecB family endonuclease NucS